MIDWTDAFDNSGYVPGSDRLAEIWAAQAAKARANWIGAGTAELDRAYGPAPRNRLDLFRPDRAARGLLVFVHGGYWQRFDKSLWSHLATGPLAHGWAVAMPSYTLAPEARIAGITREIGMAIAEAAGAVNGPIRLTGHSAGGHLVARMGCTDAPLQDEVAARIERIVPISGVFDLRPLMQAGMNAVLRLDDAEANAESPALLAPSAGIEHLFWVGASERPEFLRQTRMVTERWGLAGARASDIYEPGRNHFSVVEGLGQPQSPLTEAVCA